MSGETRAFGGLAGGLPVVETLEYDADASPAMYGNIPDTPILVARYNLTAYSLTIDGQDVLPTPSSVLPPQIDIYDLDAAYSDEYSTNGDDFYVDVSADGSVGSVRVTEFILSISNDDNTALTNTDLPVSSAYFDQFDSTEIITQLNYTGDNNLPYAGSLDNVRLTVSVVPEPASLSLLTVGAGLALFRRRRA